MVASRAAFAAQVAELPRAVTEGWEQQQATMMVRAMGLTDEAAGEPRASRRRDAGAAGPTPRMQELQARRHLLFADAGGGGMGYEGLGDSIRATIVVDYVVRRSSVGTAAAELAKCQEARLWSMSQDPRAHTTKEGTGPDGERRQRWALQRVHAALPEGGVHSYRGGCAQGSG